MSIEKKNNIAGKDLKRALEDACEGAVYISETDAAIEPVLIEGTLLSIEEAAGNLAASGPVESMPVEEFFDKLTKDREWHGEAEKKRVRQFRKITMVISDNLADVRMFKAGRVRFRIFVLGRDVDGNIAGIRTESVET